MSVDQLVPNSHDMEQGASLLLHDFFSEATPPVQQLKYPPDLLLQGQEELQTLGGIVSVTAKTLTCASGKW